MTIISTSTSAFYDRSLASLQDLRSQAETLQAGMSTGQRLTTASDDPVAAARMRQLTRLDSLSTIDTANAQSATGDLNLADGTLSSMADAITQAQQLASQAATGTLNDTQRKQIGAQISAIRDSIINLANTRDSAGHALFGGEAAGAAYTLDASGNAVYAGTGSSGQVPLGDGQTVTRSLTGPEFLNFTAGSTPTDLMAVLKTLGDALQTGGTGAQAAAHDSLDSLTAGLSAVTTAQTVVGTRLSWIDLNTQRNTSMGDLRSTEEASVGGTDVTATVAKLQETMTVLEASQASFTKLAGLSLFNLLQ